MYARCLEFYELEACLGDLVDCDCRDTVLVAIDSDKIAEYQNEVLKMYLVLLLVALTVREPLNIGGVKLETKFQAMFHVHLHNTSSTSTTSRQQDITSTPTCVPKRPQTLN